MINLNNTKFEISSWIWMLCPKLPIWDLCQQPRPRVDSPRRLIMLTNAQSHMPWCVMSVTDSGIGRVPASVTECHEIQMFPSVRGKCQGMWPGPGVPMSAPKFSVKCLGQGTLGTQLRCSLRNNHARARPGLFSWRNFHEANVKYDSFGISGRLKLQCFNEDAAKNRFLFSAGMILRLN